MTEPKETLKSDSEMLQIIIEGLIELRLGQTDLAERLDNLEASSKSRAEKIRGDLLALTGKVETLSGEVKGISGNVVVLAAATEELERGEKSAAGELKKINQSMLGLTQLCKTTYDVNSSVLENLTGVKGADRPQRKTRPGAG